MATVAVENVRRFPTAAEGLFRLFAGHKRRRATDVGEIIAVSDSETGDSDQGPPRRCRWRGSLVARCAPDGVAEGSPASSDKTDPNACVDSADLQASILRNQAHTGAAAGAMQQDVADAAERKMCAHSAVQALDPLVPGLAAADAKRHENLAVPMQTHAAAELAPGVASFGATNFLQRFAFDGESKLVAEVAIPANANAVLAVGRCRQPSSGVQQISMASAEDSQRRTRGTPPGAKDSQCSACEAPEPDPPERSRRHLRGRPPGASGGQPRAREKREAKPAEDFVAMSEAERARVLAKWRGFAAEAENDADAPFHVLVAAILHAKATEASVHKGLRGLRAWSHNNDWFDHGTDGEGARCQRPGVTAERLAHATPEGLEDHLLGVHWHKAKAKRLVSVATAIVERWGGHVPLDRASLLQLPGVGPKLAGILEFVFTGASAVASEGLRPDENGPSHEHDTETEKEDEEEAATGENVLGAADSSEHAYLSDREACREGDEAGEAAHGGARIPDRDCGPERGNRWTGEEADDIGNTRAYAISAPAERDHLPAGAGCLDGNDGAASESVGEDVD
eukprot:CAMPEP_0117457258 /NCGR_PEP_ID=MMETSP0784-20121206/301_1 /TAXON_ID=39447 /ORGANISM="" /LENGTH=568 /DNA_ID=CAMNT_0005250697 /DNA_START=3 /DNA_END=1710 /DNA_ORIENTATION=+